MPSNRRKLKRPSHHRTVVAGYQQRCFGFERALKVRVPGVQSAWLSSVGSSAGSLGALFDPTDTQYPTFTQRQRFDQCERPTSQTLLNPNALGTEGLVSSTEYDKRGQVNNRGQTPIKSKMN